MTDNAKKIKEILDTEIHAGLWNIKDIIFEEKEESPYDTE